MAVFKDYARYYNLLYRDKDYSAETDFVLNVFKAHGSLPQNLLDLGCGTGRHALEMMTRGISVTGVDMSETMLAMGRECLAGLTPPAGVALPLLIGGDARTVRLDGAFDAAVSLFHVMSYQNNAEDALAVLVTAKAHLQAGGLFIFDFWHGPGVLADPPARREKILENDSLKVVRKAEPVHRPGESIVEVHYTVTLQDKNSGWTTRFEEIHTMRYWFLPELRHLAGQAGFRVLREGGGLHDAAPGADDWNAWMLLRA
ncbi:MAG: class I SAM-dependent methyltransferase [Desulfovibrio sp.]|jgi:SAM-dependent methyltransferase|nr:class I SAM-dependent methyltransferase [Desulfovibrio sp.]